MAEKKKQPFEDTYTKHAAPGNQWLYQNGNTPAAQPTEEEAPAEEAPQAASGMTLSDMLQQIQEEKNRREKDDAAAEKRGKIREMIGSIGDAAVALNNLYHTTQYAPAPKEAVGMGDAYAERNVQDKAWRDAHRREWLNYALNIAGKKQTEEQHNERLRVNEAKEKLAREKFEAEETRKNALNEARMALIEAQRDNNEERAAYWQTKTDLLEKGYDLKTAESAALVAERNARANKINADRQGKTEETITTDERGRTKTVVKTTTPKGQQTTGQSGVKWKTQNTTKNNTGVTWK